MHKFSAGSEEQKVAQLDKEEEVMLKMDIAPSSKREAGLNLQKKRKQCTRTHLNVNFATIFFTDGTHEENLA